ncbi:MAG: TetR/AcrR family transcriptional regulator [Myxococcota bacterium]
MDIHSIVQRLLVAQEDDNDSEVLDAAYGAFLDFGIRRTSMREIARRSGVSQATLYRRYEGKDDLVMAVMVREAHRFLKKLETAVNRDAPPIEQLTEIAVLVAQRLRVQPLVRRLLETDPEIVLEQLTVKSAPLLQAGTAYTAMYLQRLIQEGQLEPFDPLPIAEIMTRVVHSLVMTPTTSLPVDDDDSIRAVMGDLLSRLLSPPPPERS